MTSWLRALGALREGGRRAIVVTVVATRGSTPREAGARMVVEADRFDGTIGGGHLELQALGIAREMLGSDREMSVSSPSDSPKTDISRSDPTPCAPRLRRFPLGASLGQCCGGVVTLLFEAFDGADAAAAAWLAAVEQAQQRGRACVVVTPLRGSAAAKLVIEGDGERGTLEETDPALRREAIVIGRTRLDGPPGTAVVEVGATALLFDTIVPPALRLVLFGGGHVGRALAGALAGVDCDLAWVDSRDAVVAGYALPAGPGERGPDIVADPLAAVAAAAPGTCFVVMTHSHALDFDLTAAILRRGDFGYLGLIGSATKRRRFEQRLADRGIGAALRARIRCPIGIDGIDSKEPAAIAIAVAAEVLRLREQAARGTVPQSAAQSA